MSETTYREQWPSWAKALLIGMAILALISVLPWILMAAMCMPFMNNMQQMAPGMMR